MPVESTALRWLGYLARGGEWHNVLVEHSFFGRSTVPGIVYLVDTPTDWNTYAHIAVELMMLGVAAKFAGNDLTIPFIDITRRVATGKFATRWVSMCINPLRSIADSDVITGGFKRSGLLRIGNFALFRNSQILLSSMFKTTMIAVAGVETPWKRIFTSMDEFDYSETVATASKKVIKTAKDKYNKFSNSVTIFAATVGLLAAIAVYRKIAYFGSG